MKIFNYITHPYKILLFFDRIGFFKLSDKLYLKLLYKAILNKNLCLNNPQTFNEKLQWLKLNDRKDIYTKMVDKYEVKKYISSIIGEEYVIPTLGVYNHFDEIEFDKLPNEFVIKCTHDSGGLVIVKDKEKLNYKEAKKKIEKSLKNNFYYQSREWPYKNVKPRIIIEEYMEDKNINDLLDYKFFTFNGEIKCIQVDYNRFIDHHRNFYDVDWNYLPFTTCYPTDKNHIIKQPEDFNKMKEIVTKICKKINNPAFVRIDLYYINKKIYFGECTFYHGAGFEKFYPEKYNEILGSWINLKK